MTRMRRITGIASALALVLALALASCTVFRPSPEARYDAWRVDHSTEVEAYHAFLLSDSNADTVPMHALLRTSRSWRRCGHDEFSTPPPDLWPNMSPTLRVVAQLHDAGILDRIDVHDLAFVILILRLELAELLLRHDDERIHGERE